MAIMDLSIDAERAIERLMRFLAVEGVTGRERAIGAEVEKALRKAGVPASAIRYDTANERYSRADRDGQSDRATAGNAAGPRDCCS